MKYLSKYALVILVLSSPFFLHQNAGAWVAAGTRGGFGGHGFVAAGGHPPPPPIHHGGGCYGCGAAGFAMGAMTGAAIAHASTPSTVYVNPAPTVVVQQPEVVVQSSYSIGTHLAQLPEGSKSMVVNGVNYYQSGSVWFKPYFGASGVYYEVVQAP